MQIMLGEMKMFDLIYNKAINTIKEHNMLEDCETVIAGVSGGADSYVS